MSLESSDDSPISDKCNNLFTLAEHYNERNRTFNLLRTDAKLYMPSFHNKPRQLVTSHKLNSNMSG